MHEAVNSGIQPRWVGVGHASLRIWQSVRAEQPLTNMRDRLVIPGTIHAGSEFGNSAQAGRGRLIGLGDIASTLRHQQT